MHRRFWQTATAGLAVGLLGAGAWAQWDVGEPADEADRPAAPPMEERADDDRDRDRMALGTVDVVEASHAYQRLTNARAEADGAEAGAVQPIGGGNPGREEAAVDPAMIDKVRDKARQAADERDVDLVVLEVLHDNDADIRQVDLTSDVIAKIDERAEELRAGEREEADDVEDDWGDITW